MIEVERSPGEAVRVGSYTLRVLAVRLGEVVFALEGPGQGEPSGEPESGAEGEDLSDWPGDAGRADGREARRGRLW